jgi:hypothetical protein
MLCIEAREPEPTTQVEEVEDSDKDLELMSTWHLLILSLMGDGIKPISAFIP